MTIPVKKKVLVINATYIEETQSILIKGECENGRLTHQINRSLFNFGTRTEEEITAEMHKTAALMKGKTIDMVFDTELDDKIKDHHPLKY